MSEKDFTQELAGFPGLLIHTRSGCQRARTDDHRSNMIRPMGPQQLEVADYRLVEGVNARLLPAYGEVWPATLDGSGTVRITGTAGYADDEAPDLDQACLMLVAHWYLNREAGRRPTAPAVELPLAVEMLIRPYRPSGLA
jgi:hypothetical protein